MNRHFYKLITPVYKSLLVRFRTETASSHEFCVTVFLSENSRFDKQCNTASPLWNIGLKCRAALPPLRSGRGTALAVVGSFISFEFQYLTPKNVACQTGSNLTNQLHHRTWKRTHDKTLN